MTTLGRITRALVAHRIASAKKINLEARFHEDLGIDSLDHIDVVVALESEFGIEIDDSQANTLNTVGDAVKLIDRLAVLA